jgi:hypothetical protein
MIEAVGLLKRKEIVSGFSEDFGPLLDVLAASDSVRQL